MSASERERDERSGSSQSREDAHTNRRELSQEPLVHSGGTQAGQQAVPGTGPRGQAVRGIRLLEHRENPQRGQTGQDRDSRQSEKQNRRSESRQPVARRHLSVNANRQPENRQLERAGRETGLSDGSESSQLERRL